MKNLFAAIVALTLPIAAQAAEAVKDTSYVAAGSRVLRHEIVVAASAADAWSAFTTVDGWRGWATPYVTLSTAQLAVDAEFESSRPIISTPSRVTSATSITVSWPTFLGACLRSALCNRRRAFRSPTKCFRSSPSSNSSRLVPSALESACP